ncbi:ABC transporter ATP-binding protein/permease [Amycolatopsis regifaucium]|uniref:ABC transporter ATP-binding protein n=1 Tax=Amycolatopsis regifaucium TaxID=546365 RepID=A0A154M5C6_9PSEU|nr:ABC transporter ATP-binding protein/permease [Amycolatopsis regifaucium]KZB79818.1 hypothetical protein AVL48_15670 [Amycolatopsis regifaucium]OKA09864.1 hypothetical protein ATP06_0205740 [Amycolatopsis regifaucium]SFJ32786.1 hypothetical protein SAMN04489731_1198 [Amycolatopsis regifaucium]
MLELRGVTAGYGGEPARLAYVVVMVEGRVRASGTHEQLLATDTLYRELVEALRIAGDGVLVKPR